MKYGICMPGIRTGQTAAFKNLERFLDRWLCCLTGDKEDDIGASSFLFMPCCREAFYFGNHFQDFGKLNAGVEKYPHVLPDSQNPHISI